METKSKQFHGYIVTTSGEIYSAKTGERKYTWANKGRSSHYEKVQLSIEGKVKNFYVHRLVAMVFIKGFKQTLEVDHKDGNTMNNDLSNLRVMTHSQNVTEWHKCRIKKSIKGTRCLVKEATINFYTAGEFMPNKPESEKDQKYKPHFLAWAQSYEHEVREFRELIESRPSDLKELKAEFKILTGKQYRRQNEN